MDSTDFNIFLSALSAGIMENQSNRIKGRFNGSFSTENLVAEIIAECHVCTVEYIKAYNEWLLENFDIKPKS